MNQMPVWFVRQRKTGLTMLFINGVYKQMNAAFFYYHTQDKAFMGFFIKIVQAATVAGGRKNEIRTERNYS